MCLACATAARPLDALAQAPLFSWIYFAAARRLHAPSETFPFFSRRPVATSQHRAPSDCPVGTGVHDSRCVMAPTPILSPPFLLLSHHPRHPYLPGLFCFFAPASAASSSIVYRRTSDANAKTGTHPPRAPYGHSTTLQQTNTVTASGSAKTIRRTQTLRDHCLSLLGLRCPPNDSGYMNQIFKFGRRPALDPQASNARTNTNTLATTKWDRDEAHTNTSISSERKHTKFHSAPAVGASASWDKKQHSNTKEKIHTHTHTSTCRHARRVHSNPQSVAPCWSKRHDTNRDTAGEA